MFHAAQVDRQQIQILSVGKDGFGRRGEGLAAVVAVIALSALAAMTEAHDVSPLTRGQKRPWTKRFSATSS